MEEATHNSTNTAMDEEQTLQGAKEIRDSMMALASKLSKKNLLNTYREKLLESFKNGEGEDEDDEMVNSEDFMVEEGDEEAEDGPGLPPGIDLGAIMKNLTGAFAGSGQGEEGEGEGESVPVGNPMDMIKNMMAGMMEGMPSGPTEGAETTEGAMDGEEPNEETEAD
jgi:hypothetical protein